jgi:hypothetical protein
VRREGERMFQLLISLIGAIVPYASRIDQSVQSRAPATRRSVFAPACVCMRRASRGLDEIAGAKRPNPA